MSEITATEPLAALKKGDLLEFWGNDSPKCPHCAHVYDIQEREAWNLYEEGDHKIECPSCDRTYKVTVNVSYSYSTDEQDEDEP